MFNVKHINQIISVFSRNSKAQGFFRCILSNKVQSTIGLVCFSVIGQLVLDSSLSAQTSLTVRQHAIVRTYITDGSSVSFSAPNVPMNANWITSDGCRFVLKGTWLRFENPRTNLSNGADVDWIELGKRQGGMAPYTGNPTPQSTGQCGTATANYYDAYYTGAWQTDPGTLQGRFRQYAIVGPSLTGSHTYEVRRKDPTTWEVYIDGVRRLTYSA